MYHIRKRRFGIHIIQVCVDLTFYNLAVSLRASRFNIKKFYVVFALLLVLCKDLGTDSDLCFIRHLLIGFYNRDGKCLQRGTDCFLI